ncbi:MAG: YraN family protein [Chloroflexaceae bacterium]|nr:YraN family protein [Chloroflexaceae bacterium]
MNSIIGDLGEQLVVQWLLTQGWSVLQRRWHSRWGEIDAIALEKFSQTLAFVEVKTRGLNNWDEAGLLAIAPAKQAKLWKTAALFLAKYPHWADYTCRFDVALVRCRQISAKPGEPSHFPPTVALNQPIHYGGYELCLHAYIPAAFTGE